MKIGVIILARANYGRWPDKVLYKLQGKTILEHVIRKSQEVGADEVIVSTTASEEDFIISNIAHHCKASVSIGSPDDRTQRYMMAIYDGGLDYFIPISPATPFFDADYQNNLIAAARKNPGFESYFIGAYNSWVAPIYSRRLIIDTLHNENRDEEIFIESKNITKSFSLYNWHDPELKNRYLFNGNIAYKLQAENHQKICEYLGHFPKNYNEVVKALMGIGG